jgi:hypothetical protein
MRSRTPIRRWAIRGSAAAFTAVALTAGMQAAVAGTVQATAARAPHHRVVQSFAVHHDVSPPLRSIRPLHDRGRVHPVRHARVTTRVGRVVNSPDTSGLRHPLIRNIPPTSADFAGGGDTCGCQPPDTQGAAGPTQYVQLINLSLAVYSKTGSRLLGPESTNTLWSGFGGGCQANNDGDGVALYDALSGRWVISQFSVSTTPYLECVAVSQTSDATGAWNRYAFQTPAQSGTNGFPDYPKMGVWPNGYYTTFDLFNGNSGAGSYVCAYNKAAMLAGQAASQQCTEVIGPTSIDDDTVLPASVEGATAPPAGSNEYLAAIPQSTSAQSSLLTWTYHVDFSNPANSSLSALHTLSVNSYTEPCVNNRNCVPQGGTTTRLDGLGDRLMARLSYRNNNGTESLEVAHSVVSGSAIGVRWYQLTPSGGVLSLAQQGTVAPDSTYRWMPSITQDGSGDIAVGYSASSSSISPQIRYTGRLPSDAAGTMPQGEGTIALTGAGSQTSGSRWGDYSSMTVDPTDNCTFWYTDEHGTSGGDWATTIASFKFTSCGSVGGNTVTVTNPGNQTGTVGTAVNLQMQATDSQSGQMFTWNATGLPAGLSINSSSGLISGTPTTANTYNVTVTATDTTGASGSASFTWTINSSGGCTASQLLRNPGFESGNTIWSSTPAVIGQNGPSEPAHAGTWDAWLDGYGTTHTDTLSQAVTIPAACTHTTFSFWLHIDTSETTTTTQFDKLTITANGTTLATFSNLNHASGYQQHTYSLGSFAGQTVTLKFSGTEDVSLQTSFVVDDTAVNTS